MHNTKCCASGATIDRTGLHSHWECLIISLRRRIKRCKIS